MQDNDIKQRTLITLGLPSADVDFLTMLQKFIERETERRQRIVQNWLSIRIDGVHHCVIDSQSWCRLEFEGGTSKVEIVGRDAEGEVVIATYLPTYDGPKTEAWRVSLPWGDEVVCTFEYDDEECVRVEVKRLVKPKLGEKHTQLTSKPEPGFFEFDRAYVERLRNGDPATEHHFFVYFEKLLQIELRARAISSDKVEDLKQETFTRVIAAVGRGGVVQPERLGTLVVSICNSVLLEHYRALGKNQRIDEMGQEIPDELQLRNYGTKYCVSPGGMMVSKQFSERVRTILSRMPALDRDLLRAVFLEERDKGSVCREFGVDREYLRVLLHRAKDKFKDNWADLAPVWDNLLDED